jgi:chromosome segregation ATPase
MAPQEPRYAVDATAVIKKLQDKLGAISYDHALAEAAIDDLLAKQSRLLGEVQELQAEKEAMEQKFQQELTGLRQELDDLRGIAE